MATWHHGFSTIRKARSTVARNLTYQEAVARVAELSARPWKPEGREAKPPFFYLAPMPGTAPRKTGKTGSAGKCRKL